MEKSGIRKEGQIFFEADDGDVYAMALKKLFTNQSEEHYDTYVL